MRAFLGLLALLWALPVLAQPVNPATVTPVSIHGSSPPPLPVYANCPNGATSVGDPCLYANAASTITLSSFWTAIAPQTGQSYYSSNPESIQSTPFNLPGVDYPVGPYTSRGSAGDPQSAGNIPSGCTLSYPTGHANDYGLLTCTSSIAAHLWQNLDFGAVAGHGPTYIWFKNTVTTAQTFDDIWFTNAVGGTSGICAAPSPQGNFIFAQGTGSITLQYFLIDGDDADCRMNVQSGVALATGGNILIQFGEFLNSEGHAFDTSAKTGSTVTIQGNIFRNWNPSVQQAHGEASLMAGVISSDLPNYLIRYNVFFNDTNFGAFDTALVYFSNGIAGYNINNLTFDHNAIVSNTVSGTTAIKNTATISYTVANVGNTGPGYYLTVTAISAGSLQVGMSISDPNTAISPTACVSGCSGSPATGGVGSVWYVGCNNVVAACASTAVDHTGTPGCASACYTISMMNVQETETNRTLSDYKTAFGSLGYLSTLGYTQVTLTNNLVDYTAAGSGAWEVHGYAGGPPWGPGSGHNGCANATTLSGNINVNTGAAANTLTGSGNGGC